MERINIIAGKALHQQQHAAALAAGLAVHGIQAVIMERSEAARRTRTAACWSWHVGKLVKPYYANLLVMERGYIGDRFAWTSMGWNGLNGFGRFTQVDDASRFEKHFAHLMQPWKSSGEYVLVIGQVPGDASLRNINLMSWYCDAVRNAAVYGLPVYFRQHPEAIKRGCVQQIPGAAMLEGSLDEALAKAHVVISFNSNVGVDAVMAGCPVVAMDRGSMAWSVAAHKIGERITPDRTQWATQLAWCQWTLEEIRSGAAWEIVREELRISNVAS